MTDFIYEKVMRAVNEVDPMKLFKLGCPEDEYAPEVRLIVLNITQGKQITSLLLKTIFEKMFYKDCCYDTAYEDIEKKIEEYL